MNQENKIYRLAVTVKDKRGRKVKELIEEIPASMSVQNIIDAGKRVSGITKEISLTYEIREVENESRR